MLRDMSKGNTVHGSIKATTKNTVYKIIGIPANVQFIKIYPKTGVFSFAFNEDPAIGSDLVDPGSGINFSSLSKGGIAVGSYWEIRMPSLPNSAELRFISDTDNATAWIEFTAG